MRRWIAVIALAFGGIVSLGYSADPDNANQTFTEQNGYKLYPPGSKLDLGLEKDIEVKSRYGFKIIQHDGKKLLVVATKKEWTECEAKRLGMTVEQFEKTEPTRGCWLVSDGNGKYHCAGESGCVLAETPQHVWYCFVPLAK
jgi:hypothetical protein